MTAFDFANDARAQIAQTAAKLIYEEGVTDYAQAKRKAIKRLGFSGNVALPTNSEIDTEVRAYHALYSDEADAEHLTDLRQAAAMTMQLLQKFNPHLTGCVADGTAGPHASTDIHVFAESAKEVEIFLLNQNIPYELDEKAYRLSERPSKDKHEYLKKRVPVVLLETTYGTQKISIFDTDDIRIKPRGLGEDGYMRRVNLTELTSIIQSSKNI